MIVHTHPNVARTQIPRSDLKERRGRRSSCSPAIGGENFLIRVYPRGKRLRGTFQIEHSSLVATSLLEAEQRTVHAATTRFCHQAVSGTLCECRRQ